MVGRIVRKLRSMFAGGENVYANSDRYVRYLADAGITIGKGNFFQSPGTACVDVTRPLLVEIGDNCTFLEHFTLLSHDAVRKVFRNVYHDFLASSGPVKIGNNVYFARNCTVLKGVTIGDNCIIGFGSLVTRDIPANSVAVGCPARVICSIEDYYEKRKRESLEEAFEYARIIYRKTGKRPTVEQMYEEFYLWMEGDCSDERLKFQPQLQLGPSYDIWKREHKAPFRSFEEFVDKALEHIDEEK